MDGIAGGCDGGAVELGDVGGIEETGGTVGGGDGWAGADGAAMVGAEGVVRVGVRWAVLCVGDIDSVVCGDTCLCICKEFTIILANFMFPFSFRWRKSRKYKFTNKWPFSSTQSEPDFKNLTFPILFLRH